MTLLQYFGNSSFHYQAITISIKIQKEIKLRYGIEIEDIEIMNGRNSTYIFLFLTIYLIFLIFSKLITLNSNYEIYVMK